MPEALRGEGVLPIAPAAVQAVSEPGTELDGTEVAGRRAASAVSGSSCGTAAGTRSPRRGDRRERAAESAGALTELPARQRTRLTAPTPGARLEDAGRP